MIDFRYHLVSLLAVLLALAVGIVVGTTTMSRPAPSTSGDQVARLTTENRDLQGSVRQLEAAQRFDDAFLRGLTPALVAGRLAGSSVLVVLLPGADPREADELARVVELAGGKVTGRVTFKDKYVEAAQAQVLDDLTGRLVPPNVSLNRQGSTPYDRSAVELASILVTNQPSQVGREAPQAATILTGFQSIGFLDYSGTPAKRASLVVVLTGAPAAGTPPPPEEQRRVQGAWLSLATALDAQGRGTVVAGPATAAATGGLLTVLRGSPVARQVSTVDGTGTVAARVSVVLALAEQDRGRAGQYGSGTGATAPAPAVTPGGP
ncbi:MAG: copper transporter [Actinomycetota bacterium]